MYSGKKRRGVRTEARVSRREGNKGEAKDTKTHWQIFQETTFCNPLQAEIECKWAFLTAHFWQDFFWSLCPRYTQHQGEIPASVLATEGAPHPKFYNRAAPPGPWLVFPKTAIPELASVKRATILGQIFRHFSRLPCHLARTLSRQVIFCPTLLWSQALNIQCEDNRFFVEKGNIPLPTTGWEGSCNDIPKWIRSCPQLDDSLRNKLTPRLQE